MLLLDVLDVPDALPLQSVCTGKKVCTGTHIVKATESSSKYRALHSGFDVDCIFVHLYKCVIAGNMAADRIAARNAAQVLSRCELFCLHVWENLGQSTSAVTDMLLTNFRASTV